MWLLVLNFWKVLVIDDWFGMVIICIQCLRIWSWLMVLNDCDLLDICIIVNVLFWVGLMELIDSGIQLICDFIMLVIVLWCFGFIQIWFFDYVDNLCNFCIFGWLIGVLLGSGRFFGLKICIL